MNAKTILVGVLTSMGLLVSGNLRSADDIPRKARRNVAIVVHEGVELLDFAGPGEVFQVANHGRAFNVYTVAETTKPILSQRFLRITPQYGVSDCPRPDIIVIPGGNTPVLLNNKAMMVWIKESAKDAELMFSVCTGAFALARAGLLDGKKATTHHSALARLKRDFPNVTVLADQRVVDNGKVITAAGVSAGIDGALHVVARLCGPDVARDTARYMEYKWIEGELPAARAVRIAPLPG